MEKTAFYCINYKDDFRKGKLETRFRNLGLHLHFVAPVEKNDPRLEVQNVPDDKRTCAIMLQHLDSIRHFMENTDLPYCIVCEDDILLTKHFRENLKEAVVSFEELDLDVLLLGYLAPFKIESWNSWFPLKTESVHFRYMGYPNDLWGAQMYLLSRKHAQELLEKYTVEWAIQNVDKPYNPDWTITKDGNRAIMYPMLAVEEGTTKTDHTNQNEFHHRVFITNYVEGLYF